MEKAKGRGHPAQQKGLVKPVLETIATELATDGTLPTAAQLVESGDVVGIISATIVCRAV